MPHDLVMPEDGWDLRHVDYHCPVCRRTRTAVSHYLNLDALLDLGMTQAEFFLGLHLSDYHPFYAVQQARRDGFECDLRELELRPDRCGRTW